MNRGAWKKLVSTQRKRAVMACFRMQPFYALPRHRAINHFLMAYHDGWLNHEQSLGVQLIEEITGSSADEGQLSLVHTNSSSVTVAPIAGMPPSSSGDGTGGPIDGTAGNSGSGVSGEGDGAAAIARAMLESSFYSDSSDEGKTY